MSLKDSMVLLSCEHAGARIPCAYQSLFAAHTRRLKSHQGWDVGALHLAKRLARCLKVPLFSSTVSRLLVDLNRSLGHPTLFSSISCGLSPAIKQTILDAYYHPHRQAIEQAVDRAVGCQKSVVHVGIHTFAPCVGGKYRTTDIGLLYDPSRSAEKKWCQAWKKVWHAREARYGLELRVRFNSPYRGTSDGLTTHLRHIFKADGYVGIELEVNQRHWHAGNLRWLTLERAVCHCFASLA